MKRVMDTTQNQNSPDPIEQLRRRLGRLEPQQIVAWQQMTPRSGSAWLFKPTNLLWRLSA
jgi:hypothetical protein